MWKSGISQAALVGAIVCFAGTAAAETGTEAGEERESRFDTVIVTGSATGQSKFETAYSVSDFSGEEIAKLAPLNTADLIGQAPGVYAEASGGEASNVYRVRGIPSEGAFYAFHEDGMPIYQENAGFFFTGDGVVRTDLMTERFEAVRGGPAPIFASNASAIFNQITRQGGDTPGAALQTTLGDTGLYRADGYWSGPLGGGFYLAAGGFYRHHEGYRDNGFPSDRGGQFRVNLRRQFDNGEIRTFIKRFDDSNSFYLPLPLRDPRDGSSLADLIDPLKGTLNTPALKNAQFIYPGAGGERVTESRDLSDGRRTTYTNTGFDADFDVAGFRFQNFFRYTKGDVDFDALYSTNAPAEASTFADGFLDAAQTAFTGVDRIGYALAGSAGLQAYDPGAARGLVMQGQYRNIQSDFESMMNDFRISREVDLAGRHNLTGGVYLARFSTEASYRGQDYLFELRTQPRLLDMVAYDEAGNPVGFVTDNGVLRYSSTLIAGEADTDYWALYLANTWEVTDRLSVEAGVRYNNFDSSGFFKVPAPFNLGDPDTLADNAAQGHIGFNLDRGFKDNHSTWTLGANYEVNDWLGTFVRTSKAVRGPSDLNVIFPLPATNTETRQYELGLKVDRPTLSVFATAFYSEFEPFTATLFELNPDTGEQGFVSFVGSVTSPGVEVDFTWRPDRRFTLDGAVTLSDVQLGDFVSTSGAQAVSADGNQPIRQPNVYGNLRPTAHFELGDWYLDTYLRYNFVGDRYVDLTNQTLMPAYQTIGAGITLSNDDWSLQLVGDNLTNELGITEGNPRVDQIAGQGASVVNYGRPIFGRNFRLVLRRQW